MPVYEAKMRVTYREVWQVEAENEEAALEALKGCASSVELDEGGGEMVNWDLSGKIKKVG